VPEGRVREINKLFYPHPALRATFSRYAGEGDCIFRHLCNNAFSKRALDNIPFHGFRTLKNGSVIHFPLNQMPLIGKQRPYIIINHTWQQKRVI